MTLHARRTLAALALTAAAVLTGLTAQSDQHSTHTQADSIWGIVTPANPTPAAPAPEPSDPATPQDSIWG